MIQNVSFNAFPKVHMKKTSNAQNISGPIQSYDNSKKLAVQFARTPVNFNTTLSNTDKIKYSKLCEILRGVQAGPNSSNLTPIQQLDMLLKNGKLLQKTNHDNSTTLDNLLEMATKERAYGLSNVNLVTNTLDLLTNPRFVTQTFGDIPEHVQKDILQHLPNDDEVKKNPESMNVYASGTCAAASMEVNMADKYPAEFARWVSNLSSKDGKLFLNVKMASLSKNILQAMEFLKLFEARTKSFSFDKTQVLVDLDLNAFIRAFVQNNYWDKGERNVADVLVQSAIMKLGSQNTYNALTDVRSSKFNSNSQGLIEQEKTFVESLIKNKEITSLVYQKIDDNQNLVGYNCSFDKIQKHIIDTIDSGDDVILGYVLVNSDIPNGLKDSLKNPKQIISGHEITVVDYHKNSDGKMYFVCVDTDDDNTELVEYSADWLLPKIHHAGYPAHIVKDDEKEIMKQFYQG